jgi:hypothetical protein
MTKTIDVSCSNCCHTCPTSCTACPPLSAALSSTAAQCKPATIGLLPQVSACTWQKTNSAGALPNCLVTEIEVGCNHANGQWYIAVELSSCCLDLLGSVYYYLEIGTGACPPKATYTVPLVPDLIDELAGPPERLDCCANSITVVLS